MGKKTGPKPKFGEDDVINAAFRCGIATFSMSQIAKEIGVAPGAIYRVFESREAIVRECHRRAIREIRAREVAAADTWQEVLRRWASACWDVCEEFEGLSLSIFTYRESNAVVEPYICELADRLVELGLARENAYFAIDFVGDTIVSTHLGMSNFDKSDAQWCDDSWKFRKTNFIIAGLEAGLG